LKLGIGVLGGGLQLALARAQLALARLDAVQAALHAAQARGQRVHRAGGGGQLALQPLQLLAHALQQGLHP
jgi:hypothetical protein